LIFILKSIDIYIYRCYNKLVRKIKPQQKGKVNKMENYRVEQMINDRGNGAMNQFVIYADSKVIFQSYNSIIAVVDRANKSIELGSDWDYSVTTSKHRNIFFRDYANIPDLASRKGILDALKNGLCNGWTIKFVA
jgi:hypothetical protein